MTSNKTIISCAAALLIAASPLSAIVWTGDEDTNWFNENNWDTKAIPTTNDVLTLNQLTDDQGGLIPTEIAIADAAATAHAFLLYTTGSLTVQGSSSSSKGVLNITGTQDRFVIQSRYEDSPAELIIKANGTVSMTTVNNQRAYIATSAGQYGYMRVETGGLFETYYSTSILASDGNVGQLQVGGAGYGVLDVAGGTVKVQNFRSGSGAGGVGITNVIDGGLLQAGYTLHIGNMGGNATTEGAKGTLNVLNGSVTTRQLYLGTHALSDGSTGIDGLTAASGTINLYDGGSVTASSATYIGYSGQGEFNVYGGTAALGSLYLGYNQTHGTIAGSGDLNISGGSVSAGTVYMSYGATNTSSMDISDGSFTSSGTINIGYNGEAEVYVSGSGKLAANTICLGYNAGSEGLLEIQAATGSLYRSNGTTLTSIQGRNGTGILRFNYEGAMSFANVLSGNGLRLEHTNTAATTLTGSNTYAGGTILSGGTLVAANSSALGSGNLKIDGGTLAMTVASLKAANVSLESGRIALTDAVAETLNVADFEMEGGYLEIDILSLGSFDQISSSGGAILLSGGVLLLSGYEGFEGTLGAGGNMYQIFSGFNEISDYGIEIRGYDSANWVAGIDGAGNLYFSEIPEPAEIAMLLGLMAFGFIVCRR